MKRQRLVKRQFPENPKDAYRFRKSIASARGQYESVEEYIDLCERGTFYESLMRDGEDRGEFKQKFYTEVFFGKASWRTSLKRRFEKQHPAIAQLLKALKTPDYRRSAWIMQNTEATIFIDGVCGRVMQERPDMALFTIHDSFMVKQRDAKYVKQVTMDEFKQLGITPKLQIK